ncbi:MAG: PIN domain-containing protein [Crocosphaera sp.]|nr:PIN domain-containing protein [Crocosphaera sp.]
MYLLDTNHYSRIIFRDENLCKKVSQIGESFIFTNVIVGSELIFIAQKSNYPDENLAKVTAFLNDINLYSLNEETANIYGHLKGKIINQFGPKEKARKRKITIDKLGISDHDLWITATAIQEHLTIVSRDKDFLRINQVHQFTLENWL